jgi:hypothetical protein
MKKNPLKLIILIISALAICSVFFIFYRKQHISEGPSISSTRIISTTTTKYTGKIYHIFFHSLIIYPEKAAHASKAKKNLFESYMITSAEFKIILQQLYDNNFILVDSKDLFAKNADGQMSRKELYLPNGKKPLIISLDDLNYYLSNKDYGFADKLVISNNIIQTEVLTPDGKTIITDDGDVVPIVDSFVKEHPDFSFNGAKGLIGVTGLSGILGYRTQTSSSNRASEIEAVKPIITALKNTGWTFANHSYSHDQSFLTKKITLIDLQKDIQYWKNEVEPLVGNTSIYIGPFGQVFGPEDVRRKAIVDAGYNILYGVGLDQYLKCFPTYCFMDRFDIDGYRLTHDVDKLNKILGIKL